MRRRTFVAVGSASILVPAFVPSGRAAEAPVVLELFTSRGCSSCPPADAFLGELRNRPGVIALAWHVDYWNGIGWRDPYSSALATERQRAYADRLGEDVYTPALVVDGELMAVGSARSAVISAIDAAAAPPVPVSLRRTPTGLDITTGEAAGPVSAWLVTFVPETETRIGGGENGGRVLREFHTVRTATVLGSWNGRPRGFASAPPASGMGAAVLVQGADLRVLGAAMLYPSVAA